MVRTGAGLIMISGTPDDGRLDDWASAGRQVAGTALVGVAEPVDPAVPADVIHLTAAWHRPTWPGRLTGCEVSSEAGVDAAVQAGCAYVVADCRVPGLVGQVAESARRHPGLVWFVSGCASLAQLKEAVGAGARRVWMKPALEASVGEWSGYLRQVWQIDPDMGGLNRLRREASR